MLARKSLALAATLIGVAGASACSNASADQTMETVGASWPLSAIEAPSPTLGGRDVAAEDDSTVSEDVRLDANGSVILATPNDGPNGGGYDRPDVASGVGPSARPSVDLGASGPMIQTRAPEWVDFPNARFPRPEHVRGLYVNAWAAGSRSRMSSILDLARRTEVNSLVIDIKDAT